MSWLARVKPDGFLIAILVAAGLATVLPATGAAADFLALATKVVIFTLFFLYGSRLSTSEALKGLVHWRLHLTILAFTFVVFPLIGLAMQALSPVVITPPLAAGILYLTLVPSTVQSSVAFTSIARGNVPGAIVAASTSNLIGVALTPALVIAVMSTSGTSAFSLQAVIDIAVQILLPFLVGMALQRWTGAWVKAHQKPLRLVDRGSIVLVVYAAFSQGVREDMWSQVSGGQLLVLVGLDALLLIVMLVLTWVIPGWLGFSVADKITIQFCGSKKSLASGLPMAQVLFAGTSVGLMVLPLMVFHQLQLMACSWLAGRYARRPDVSEPARATTPS